MGNQVQWVRLIIERTWTDQDHIDFTKKGSSIIIGYKEEALFWDVDESATSTRRPEKAATPPKFRPSERLRIFVKSMGEKSFKLHAYVYLKFESHNAFDS